MDTTQPRQISVVEPVGAAIEETKKILFRPFDITKWFAIGFCAWLAMLGNGGGGGNYNFNFGDRTSSGQAPDFQREMHNIKDAALEHLPVIISVTAVVVLVILVISLVLMWLKSRGQFMFLHCVSQNVAEVVNPWKRYARQANSLFLFRIVLGLFGVIASLLFIVPLIFIFISFAKKDFKVFAAAGVVPAILLILAFIVLAIVLAIVKMLTKDFVVPVMYIQNCTVTEGWKRFWALCKANMGTFVLFLLFLFVINIAISVMMVLLVVFTCCCAACIMAIPYIGTVALLPLLVWRRAYSALFLAQFGPEFNIFSVEPQPAIPTVPGYPVVPVSPEEDLPPESPEQNF